MTARRDLGDFGERVVAHRLEAQGFAIVGRQVRLPAGEIDIVARDGTETVFVEVRTRQGAEGAAAESVTAAKLARMWRCAMEYCETNAVDPETVRLDVLTVELDSRGRVTAIDHFRGVGES